MARPRKTTNDFAAGKAAAVEFLRNQATAMLRNKQCNAHQWAEWNNAAMQLECADLKPAKPEPKPKPADEVSTTTTTD